MKNKIEIIITAILFFVAITANAQLNIGFKNRGGITVNGTPQTVKNNRVGISVRPIDTRNGTFRVGISNGIFSFRKELVLKKKDTTRPKNNIFYEGNSEY